jgi:formamidopyrimidine-DNA glycosylase
MPELPEVETVAQQLHTELSSQRLVGVAVLWERTIDRPDATAFCTALTGARVQDVGRRGKFIVIRLDTGQTLLVHLRMTGKLLVLPPDAHPSDDDYTRVHFKLDDGRWLVFSDTRKFGRMYLVDDPAEILGDLGPEPLEPAFTTERLAEMLSRRRGRIKPLLLNQVFIAGLGNIYADEALWRAQVHPLQSADTLTADQVRRLYQGIVSILHQALAEGGTSLRDNQYRMPDGSTGAYQELLSVYGRVGQPCPRCHTAIERLVVGQRGTHYCPDCQRLP